MNFLKVAIRLVRRYKAYAFINMAGLALGMTVSALILLWVVDELSYDRFHEHSRRIQRVGVDFQAGTHMTLVMSMPALAEAARNRLPEVENTARISRPGRTSVQYREVEFHEDLVCYADQSLFEVFSFPFIAGDAENALTAPYSVVLSEEIAEKYFGTEDPIGKMIRLDGLSDYMVTGIVKNIPFNSHFRFRMVRSFETLYSEQRQNMENWFNIQYYTYLLLDEGADGQALRKKFTALVDEYMGDALNAMGGSLDLFFEPLTRIHLFSDKDGEIAPQGNITYVFLFSGIAFFVLLQACINFINLSTARSGARAREIGTRKTLGSSRGTIVYQILVEALIHSMSAFLLACVFIELSEPLFESLIGRALGVSLMKTPILMLGFAGLSVLVGALSGLYPALYLSSFRPVRAVKGGFIGRTRTSRFRNILVVFQFSVSIILIIGTITIYQQIHYMKTKYLGLQIERILVIPQAQSLLQEMSFATAQKEFLGLAGVENVAGSALVPTRGIQHAVFYPEGFTRAQPQKLTRLDIEPTFLKTMNIEILAGRNFSGEIMTDPEESLLINQTAAAQLGWEDPIGKSFTFWPSSGEEGKPKVKKVIGLVKDFHFTSLHRSIDPLVLAFAPDRLHFLSLRISGTDIPRTLNSLEKIWDRLQPGQPFDYFFLDEAYDTQYRAEERVGSLSLHFSVLAVLIGCLGLFGLAAYMAERRTKEIGIRKVLGASSPGIIRLLTKEFIFLVLMANLLAWPAAYVGLSLWLQNFPYRIRVSLLIMGCAGLLAIFAAILTVGYQALRAVRSDPAAALRYE